MTKRNNSPTEKHANPCPLALSRSRTIAGAISSNTECATAANGPRPIDQTPEINESMNVNRHIKNSTAGNVAAMLETGRFSYRIVPGVGLSEASLELVHVRTGLRVERESPWTSTAEELQATKEALYEQMLLKLVEFRHLETGVDHFARLLRCEYANHLIQIISSYGRGFFYSKADDRVAHLSYDLATRRVYLQDERTDQMIDIRLDGQWEGFSHGGTLRDLVEQLDIYVMRAVRLDPAYIGVERHFGTGNIWGYSVDQIRQCRLAAMALPMFELASKQEAEARRAKQRLGGGQEASSPK